MHTIVYFLKKYWQRIVFISAFLYIVVPFNSLTYIVSRDRSNVLTQVDRKSIFDGGIYYTPGRYTHLFSLPKQYVNPYFIRAGFEMGSFDLLVQWKADTCILYPGSTYCDTANLSPTFKIIEESNYDNWVRKKMIPQENTFI